MIGVVEDHEVPHIDFVRKVFPADVANSQRPQIAVGVDIADDDRTSWRQREKRRERRNVAGRTRRGRRDVEVDDDEVEVGDDSPNTKRLTNPVINRCVNNGVRERMVDEREKTTTPPMTAAGG